MFSDKKEELSILIYISTSEISASFVLFSKTQKPKILYSVSQPFSLNLKMDDFTSPSTVSGLLDTTLTKLVKDSSNFSDSKIKYTDVKSIDITFSAPWFVSRVKDIHLEQKVPFIISENFIHSLLQTEEKAFEKELSLKSDEINISGNMSIIENTYTHSKINGYSISNNFGKKTNNFDISLYSSYLAENLVKEVIGKIQKHFHLGTDKIYINTFPLVFFYAMKSIFPTQNSFLFMNVEGETTNLTSVHDGGINYNISFPSARNFIIRQIAKKFDVSPEIATSMLSMYNSQKIDDEILTKMKGVLYEIEKEWSIYFEDALIEVSKNAPLSTTVYMIAEYDIAIIYDFFMKMAKTDTTAILRKNLNIVHINVNSFSNFCVFDTDKNIIKDEYIAMLSIFYNKIKLGN